jgi:hypothetical protein
MIALPSLSPPRRRSPRTPSPSITGTTCPRPSRLANKRAPKPAAKKAHRERRYRQEGSSEVGQEGASTHQPLERPLRRAAARSHAGTRFPIPRRSTARRARTDETGCRPARAHGSQTDPHAGHSTAQRLPMPDTERRRSDETACGPRRLAAINDLHAGHDWALALLSPVAPPAAASAARACGDALRSRSAWRSAGPLSAAGRGGDTGGERGANAHVVTGMRIG